MVAGGRKDFMNTSSDSCFEYSRWFSKGLLPLIKYETLSPH